MKIMNKKNVQCVQLGATSIPYPTLIVPISESSKRTLFDDVIYYYVIYSNKILDTDIMHLMHWIKPVPRTHLASSREKMSTAPIMNRS